jgi:polar amino acid transport system substrate-binding protein
MRLSAKLLASIGIVCGVTAAHAETTLERIMEAGQITAATEAANAPMEFKQDDAIVGLTPELLTEVAKDLGVKLKLLDIPFQSILVGLTSGQYDMVGATVAINPKRAAEYGFTRPFAAQMPVLMTLADGPQIANVEGMRDKLIATQLGSGGEVVARQINDDLKKNGAGFSDLRLYQSFPDVIFALSSGQVDGALVSSLTASMQASKFPGKFRVAVELGGPRYLAWVTRPEDKELREKINATIDRLNASGQLAEMQKKWIGASIQVPADGYLPEGAVK